MERRNYGVSVQGPNEDYSIILSEVKGWRAPATWLIDSIPSRLCCGRWTCYVLYRPIHSLLNVSYSWWTETRIPISKEDARKIGPEFVGIFDEEEE